MMKAIPLLLLAAPALSHATVFFSVINDSSFGGNEIRRIENDGSGLTNLYQGLGMPLGMSYDTGRNRIYWADGYDTLNASNRPTIQSSAVDGSGTQALRLLPNYPGPTTPVISHLTFDSSNDQIYWSDVDTTLGLIPGVGQIRGYVGTTAFDGSNLAPAFTYTWAGGTIPGSTNMPIAAGSGNLFHAGSVGQIFANGDVDTPLIQRNAGVNFQAMGLYEAGAQSRLFWVEDQTMFSALTDGTDITQLITGIINAEDLDIDAAEGKVYWTDNRLSQDSTTQIRRANLDGTDEETIYTLADPSARIHGLAITPEPGSSVLLALASLLTFKRRRTC